MDERVKFIAAYLRGELAVSRLCDAFDVSRKTAYKWISRYALGERPKPATDGQLKTGHQR